MRLGGVRALGKRLVARLLDHAHRGEPHDGARLREDHVREVREACKHLTCGRVGQHRDEGQPLRIEPVRRDAGLGHLHEGKSAFLDARSTARDHRDHGALSLRGVLQGQRDLLTHDAPHASAHEPEVQDDQDDGAPSDGARPRHGRFGQAGTTLVPEETLLVGDTGREGERIEGGDGPIGLSESAGVSQGVDALSSGEAIVKATDRTDAVSGKEFRVDQAGAAYQACLPGRGGPVYPTVS